MGSLSLATNFTLEGVEIRESVSTDCYDIAPRLRTADTRECLAHGQDPLDALLEGYSICKEVYTVDYQGVPSIMFGCGPTQDGQLPGIDYHVGFIWLLGTDDILKFKRLFLTQSRLWLEHFQDQYDVLTNVVDIRNSDHIRWLDWMGFTILQAVITHRQHSFYRFVRYS